MIHFTTDSTQISEQLHCSALSNLNGSSSGMLTPQFSGMII